MENSYLCTQFFNTGTNVKTQTYYRTSGIYPYVH